MFTILVASLYWLIKDRLRVHVLLISSYIFYCFWDWRFTSLLVYLTLSNFFITKKMYQSESKKLLLAICMIQNIFVLMIFKYLNFFSEGAQQLFDFIGLRLDIPTVNILLPLGLSFLIFQTSSYVIDVYRGVLIPEKSLVNFATFVVYFPHMAAGPIMRAKELLPQISGKKVGLDLEGLQSAIFLIAIGLFRKIVIADTLAPFVNRVFENQSAFDWKALCLAILGFGLQIYGDFAGYSSIARGVSRLFGIEMIVNFRQPYLAVSITDFWRRWHISLSSWFREYLYVPLGGNRGTKAKTNINLIIVMVIAGLWHGAAFGFLFWGLMHGLFLVIDKQFYIGSSVRKSTRMALTIVGWFTTQSCVFFAWIFFRNPDLSDTFAVIVSIFQRHVGIFEVSDAFLVVLMLSLVLIVDFAEIHIGPKIKAGNSLIKGLVLGVLVVVICIFKSSSVVPFIYFRF